MKMRLSAVAAMTLAVTVAVMVSGCRPDDTTPDGQDSTSVVIEPIPDSLTGVWTQDTISTATDMLLLHQENLEDVFFEYDSEQLSREAMEILMENASYIMDNGDFRILIEGHCDERGTIDYNLALGEKRAMSVYDYLKDYGVDPARLQYVSYGKERPFDPGHNERAWAQNRRAHFRVLPGN